MREFGVRTDIPYRDLTDREKQVVLAGPEEKKHIVVTSRRGLHDLDFTFRNARLTVTKELERATDEKRYQRVARFLTETVCPDCGGTRLSPAARAPRIGEVNLAETTAYTLEQIVEWAAGVPAALPDEMRAMASALADTLAGMARRLRELGLGYLTLDRASATLSTGERQRVQLARAVRNRTTGVLYVLDEPSIGLHPANVEGLVGVMRDLLADGNSVVFVDHDVQVLGQASHLIEIGPASGADGGRVIAAGTADELAASVASRLGPFLSGGTAVLVRDRARADELFAHGRIHLATAPLHTVHALDVDIPRGRLMAVTGVSGSGKTTLVLEALIPALRARIDGGRMPHPITALEITGAPLTQVYVVDAAPIGINVRSTVATYSGVMDRLAPRVRRDRSGTQPGMGSRRLLVQHRESALPALDGTGEVSLDVQFLPDIDITCPVCRGSRYAPEADAARLENGMSLPDVLALTVAGALDAIGAMPQVRPHLQTLVDLGLGYLTLGEATPGLSGGEAQRLKLSGQLRRRQDGAVFVLDEPTVGLHPLDVRVLIGVLQRLVEHGATVIVIEHDLDLIANADGVVDLGPGGGVDGGRVVFAGTVDDLVTAPGRHHRDVPRGPPEGAPMHDHQTLTIARARRVLEERLRPAIHSDPHPLELAAHVVGGEPIPVAEGLSGPFAPTAIGAAWGRAWDTAWFRVSGRVPASFAGKRVEAVIDLGFNSAVPGFQAEGLVYRADGTPIRALHPRAQWVPIETGDTVVEATVEFFIEAASNPVVLDLAAPFRPTGVGEWETAGEAPLYRLRRADLCVFEPEVFELVHDVEVLLELAVELPDASTRRARILHALDRALDLIDLQQVAGTAASARAALADVLAAPAEASAQRIAAIGHAHIDSAWLWPLRETVRKVARTAASMTRLLDEHPEFVYAMSSAQQYAWLRDERPEVFARVRQAVDDGRFIPVGGMWVETDAVLPGGESLIRQIAYGQRFFREEFGVESRGAWLPDSFGYSGALPQILAGAGFEWFLTQKMSWNQTNRFPHHTFAWEGIDGTRIFTHFPPMDTYEAELSGAELARATRQFAEMAVASSSLAPTGHGDGGGGTTREMIARAARLGDLEGSARVAWQTPDDFFAQAKAELPDPPVWRGELYLELAPGHLHQPARDEAGQSHERGALRQAELWAATAAVRAGHRYPYEALDGMWREVLLLQFHDILPGSSIAWVHREARERYARIERTLQGIVDEALRALGVRHGEGECSSTPPSSRSAACRPVGSASARMPRPAGSRHPTTASCWRVRTSVSRSMPPAASPLRFSARPGGTRSRRGFPATC
ncbi:hypothetical protein [Microbacterium elymi]|uniref:glycoside hydrolase family 38 N-terminal domain-containing protein n=1 Tax=Microbacterium elymi TaxID=2909587 RepID=UPI00338E9CCE